MRKERRRGGVREEAEEQPALTLTKGVEVSYCFSPRLNPVHFITGPWRSWRGELGEVGSPGWAGLGWESRNPRQRPPY